MNEKRSTSVIVSLVAALLIPRVQKLTGITLGLDDVAALVAGAVVVWHGLCAFVERYFPPPVPRALETAPPFVPTPPKETLK